MWTQFWDMRSGGGNKEQWERIYIEAPEEKAKVIFYKRFGHNAEEVSCTCCGPDYSISEAPSLDQASAFHRGCAFDKNKDKYVERPDTRYSFSKPYLTVEQYVAQPEVLVIYAKDIKPGEDQGEVPEQGYVWQD